MEMWSRKIITYYVLTRHSFEPHLILKQTSTERPDEAEDKVEFVPLLRAVDRCVVSSEGAVEQVEEHLQVTDVDYRCDLLEFPLHRLQQNGNVLVEQDQKVRLFGLVISLVHPARHKSDRKKRQIMII